MAVHWVERLNQPIKLLPWISDQDHMLLKFYWCTNKIAEFTSHSQEHMFPYVK